MSKHLTPSDISRLLDLQQSETETVTLPDQRLVVHVTECDACRTLLGESMRVFSRLGKLAPKIAEQPAEIANLLAVLHLESSRKKPAFSGAKKLIKELTQKSSTMLFMQRQNVNFRAVGSVGQMRSVAMPAAQPVTPPQFNIQIQREKLPECTITVPIEHMTVEIDQPAAMVSTAVIVKTDNPDVYQFGIIEVSSGAVTYHFYSVKPGRYQFYFLDNSN